MLLNGPREILGGWATRKLSSRSYHMLFSMDVPVCQFKLSH